MPVPETEAVFQIEGAEATRYVLRPGEYVLGKAVDADLRVEANLVSPRHARLTIQSDQTLVEDLGSDSGTFINGRPVTRPTRVWPGQKIRLGSATVELRRLREVADLDATITPEAAAIRRLLPALNQPDRRYEIGGQIAQGGMGAILNAREVAIRREVAMKVMLKSGAGEDLVRFVEEAQITGQLEHPNIVPVHELSVDENDQVFYTMKMVRGITLRKVLDLMAAGTEATLREYPLATLLTIFQKVCDAVAFAHSRGVIHRDLKPENIMLGDFGEVLVMDWGLAKVVAERPTSSAQLPTSNEPPRSAVLSVRNEQGAAGCTQTGTILGTPQYMSPEQARGEVEQLDARTDIYALGAILYHILALRLSVTGKSAMEIVEKVARGEIAPLECGDSSPLSDGGGAAGRGRAPRGAKAPTSRRAPESLAAVVRKAMALRKEDRYASVPELQAEISAYQAGFATSAENASLLKQAVLLVRRHKAAFATAFAAWAIITALVAWFVINVTRERNRAERGEREAEQQRDRATANERRAVRGEKDAGDQRDRAEKSLATAEQRLLRFKIEKARSAFDEGRGDEGLAWLASVLRQDPQSRFAGAWLLSTLTDHNFPLPSAPRIEIRNPGTDAEWITTMQFDSDGQTLLLRTQRGVSRWNSRNGSQIGNPLPLPAREPLFFTPDGQRVLWIVGGAKAVAATDVATGETFAQTIDHPAKIVTIATSQGGSLLATADENQDIRLWDARTLKQIGESFPALQHLPLGSSAHVERLDMSADGRWLVARSGTTTQGWDLHSRQPLIAGNTYQARFHTVGSLLLLPNFSWTRWRVLDMASGHAVDAREDSATLVGNRWAVFSPDGSRLATGEGDARARIWDARNGTPISGWMRHGGSLANPQFSPEGLRLLTASKDFRCRLWDARTGELLGEPCGLGTTVLDAQRCQFSPDGAHVAVPAHSSSAVQLFDVREGRQLPFSVRYEGNCAASAFSPDGRHFAVGTAGGNPSYARVFDALTGARALPDLTHASNVSDVAFSPAGSQLATAAEDGTVQLRDALTGKPLGGPLRHEGRVRRATFSRDGQLLATSGDDMAVRIWSTATGEPAGAVLRTPFNVNRLTFSPDAKLIAMARYRGVAVDEVGSGKRHAFLASEDMSNDVSFSPDGKMVAAATDHEGVRVLDLATGQPAFPPLPHGNRVRMARFTPDGGRIVSASLDGLARVWDAHTGAPLTRPIRHGDSLLLAELSPDGERLATVGRDNAVRIWDTRSGDPVSEPMRHDRQVSMLAFSPDGRRLAVTVNPETTFLWDVPPASVPAPPWLPDLAEAVAGLRIDDRGDITSAGTGDFWSLREQLLARGDEDHYSHWASWFFADRATRTASPWTETKLSDELAKLFERNRDESNEQVLRYQPDNAVAMARYGNNLLQRKGAPPAMLRDAEYLRALAQLQFTKNEIAAQRAAGNAAYLRDTGPRGFPARDAAATARELDLTANYNMVLEATFLGGDPRFNLSVLPKGLQTFDGVRFDVRGVIVLAGKFAPSTRFYPQRVDGISVGQRAARLHVLHACGKRPPDGTKAGGYMLHYADGETRELPMIYGEDFRDWGENSDKKPTVAHAREAWRGNSAGLPLRLYHRTYENPRPDVKITTIDVTSENSEAAPFVVAITVE
jgi:WD40 repeat protein/serine/threonine protein kinase